MASSLKNSKISQNLIQEYRGKLLQWYDRHRRVIPWRALPDETPDPYHVWLSEIMCQQTTVQAVKAYYLKFLELWPTVQDLANAPQEDVMAAWAGLGYYARARNLHKCAKIVANDMGGRFPETQEELKKLPGIGEYTSAAIAAIAFNVPATVVDGNVERVMARFFAIKTPLPNAKKTLKQKAHLFFDGFKDRPGDLAQAFMDLGAGICIPKSPRCPLCPMKDGCMAYEKDIAAELPRKIKKTKRPKRYGCVYWVQNNNQEILMHRRPEKGLLGGMLALPSTEWGNKKDVQHLESLNKVKPLGTSVYHTFTHFDLELSLYTARISGPMESEYEWMVHKNQEEKLPTVFKKAFVAFRQQS